MKNKVLKLAKRMGKFTIEEITPILMADKSNIIPIVKELLEENFLILNPNGIYFYNESRTSKTKSPTFFECRTKEELNLIIKCFCADLPCTKTSLLFDLSDLTISKFNYCLRKHIYDLQVEELKGLYEKYPKIARVRKFLGIFLYFYMYNSKLYVSKKKLNETVSALPFSKLEISKFKKLYSKLTRRIYQPQIKKYIEYHIAHELWKIENNFNERVSSIYSFLQK